MRLTHANVALAEKILDRLPNTEIGKQIVAEDLAAIQAKREAAAGKLAEVRRDADKSIPPLKKRLAEAQTKVANQRKLLADAEAECNRAAHEEMGKQHQIRRDIDAELTILEQTAHPAIADFLAALDKHWEDNRNSIIYYNEQREYRFWEGRKRTRITSNSEFVKLWREAIDEARAAALALRYEVGEVDIPKRLAELKAEVPLFNGNNIDPMFESKSALMPLPPDNFRDTGKMHTF